MILKNFLNLNVTIPESSQF